MVFGASTYGSVEYASTNVFINVYRRLKLYYTGYFHTTKALLRRAIGF